MDENQENYQGILLASLSSPPQDILIPVGSEFEGCSNYSEVPTPTPAGTPTPTATATATPTPTPTPTPAPVNKNCLCSFDNNTLFINSNFGLNVLFPPALQATLTNCTNLCLTLYPANPSITLYSATEIDVSLTCAWSGFPIGNPPADPAPHCS